MPTVPSSFIPQVSETPYNAPAMGAPDVAPAKNFAPEQIKEIGQQSQNLGTVAQNLGMHLEAEIANAQVKEADNQLTDSVINTVQPYLQLQGKDAVTAYDGTKDAISKTAQDISDGLTNPLQKQMFRQVALRRLQSAHLQMQEHQLKQVHQYELTETEKRAEVNSNAAIAQWGTWQMPDSPFATAKAVALNSVNEALQKRGIPLDSATAQETRLGTSTTIHMNVIGQMLTAQNPGMAKEYFDRYQQEIDPRRCDAIGKAVKSQNAQSEGIQAAMGLRAQIVNNTADVEALSQKLYEQFGGGTPQFKPDSFKVADAELRSMYQQHKQANQENRDKLAIPVWQKILNVEASGGKMAPSDLGAMPEFQAMKLSNDPETVKTAVQISDHVWSEHHAVLVENRAEARAARAEARADNAEKAQEQASAYTELISDPDALARMPMTDVLAGAAKLGKVYGPKLVGLKNRISNPAELATVKIESSTINDYAHRLSIGKKQLPEFVDNLKGFITTLQQSKGRQLNPEEVRQACESAIQQVPSGHWFIPDQKYITTKPEDLRIPDNYNDRITKIINEKGLKDTPERRKHIFGGLLYDDRNAGRQ